MTNKLFYQAVVLATLCAAQFLMASNGYAKEETSLVADSATIDLAKNYTILEVRKAIGLCREGDFVNSVPILQAYAQKGDVGATYVLGKLYANGLGLETSTTKATELFAANCESGHTPSMIALAKIKLSSNPAESLYLIKQAAGAGDVAAMTQLGTIYENGSLGVTKNPRLAFNYYEKASDSGYPVGDFHLARFYDLGIGVSANEVQSTRYYRNAALGGGAVANAEMAKRYFQGKGLEADPIAAIGWLTRGAQNGSTESMVLLAERYELGDTLKQDLNLAGKLYSQAAKAGDPAGTYKLAMMYLDGKGTAPDPVRAYVLLSSPHAQTLPKAKSLYVDLQGRLTPSQLELATKKIEQQMQKGAAKK